MPIKVNGKTVHTSEELYAQCTDGEAHQFALDLQKIRHGYHEIPKKTVGTTDATRGLFPWAYFPGLISWNTK